MKKNHTLVIALCFAFLFSGKMVEAQTNRAIVHFAPNKLNQADFLQPNGEKSNKGTALSQVPLQPAGPFLAYSLVWYSQDWEEGTDQMIALFNGGQDSLAPVEIMPEGHVDEDAYRHVSQLYFLEKNASKFRIHFSGTHKIDSIAVHFFDPGSSPQFTPYNPQSVIPNPRSVCTCPQPAYQGRLDWCPDGSCPTDPTPEFVPDPTHIIVHHTAGTNTATDWAAVVRSIWDFHVNVNGWDDIGYNWLVDPNGVLYEGRGDGRLGAHFCAQNGFTTGICVMGDFTNIQPTNNALNKLEEFLAWECCDENIDPLGTGFHAGSGLTLPFISGHRDGCMTSCPGDSFYPLLPSVRTATQNKISAGCNSSGVLAAPTILAITFVSYNKISLSWQDNAVTENGYVIERSEGTNGNFTQIIQLPANATAYSDNSVMPNKTYFYRVRAKQNTEYSAYSNEAIAVTSLSATETVLHGGTLTVFPNPTSGLLNLSIDNQWIGDTGVSVFDAMGRQVMNSFYEGKTAGKANFQLDLSAQPAGVLMVKMMQGEDVGWFRVVKN